MRPPMALRLLVALACLSLAPGLSSGAGAQPPSPPDAIEKLVVRLEQALAGGDRAALLALTVKDTDASTVDEFAEAAGTNPTRVVIKERDRLTLEGDRRQLLIEVFVERGIEAKLATWRVDVRPPPAKTDPNDWRIERMEAVSNVSGLFRLALNATRQFDVRNLDRHRNRRDHRDDRRVSRSSRRSRTARPPSFCSGADACGLRRPIRPNARRSGSSPAPTISSRNSTPRSCGVRPSDFESRFRTESLVATIGRPGRSAPRHRSLRRVPLAHAPDRSHGLEPRSVVARALVGRPDCRSAHAPVRQPHLRALRQRGRGHHGLRSPAPPQHLHLRLGREAGDPRALLQRRRPRRLRRPRLRGRYRLLAGPLLDQRHGAHAGQGARRGDDDDDAEARRGVHGPRRLRAGIRAPPPPARRQPEQPDRESAVAGVPRQRVHADHRLQRPARAKRARSRGGQPADTAGA